MAKFDIVVPCHNYGRFLTDCVRSVLYQSISDVRVLIIDDASSDSSVEIARGLAASDSRVQVVAHAANKGHIATYNEGIAWADSDYFLLLSADDLLVPGALERAAEVMDSCPEVGLTYGECPVWRRDTPRPVVSPVQELRWTRQDLVADMCRTGSCFVAVATAIARTSVQKAVGGYRPSLPHSGDLEMWLRFGAHTEVARIDAVQGIYRKHDSAMSNAYLAEMMAEYGQRKAAFDSFFETCRDLRRDIPLLQRQVARSLADQAFDSGINYIRQGRIESGLELLRWAMSLDSRMRYLPPIWRLLRMPGSKGRQRLLSLVGKSNAPWRKALQASAAIPFLRADEDRQS
ncbi:glycosyltransferase [Bradyrhizobium sp. CCH5-F6]|jgi:glycosyltransferase involved in cell wall biosynthesis|uniref:glycosyltransferase family 2 protein n=1 Tax=Bradyrhizobium sp. CCH5-F6 TaxID=1768753 RepID=UPI00076A777C|nr:glycosyltransferase [Bradyrhizobium sp. CCH5-F6]